MSDTFPVHKYAEAPEAARPPLARLKDKFGMELNLFAKLASSPAALKGYAELSAIYGDSSLTPLAQQVVLLTVSNANGCNYCIAAHTTGSLMNGLDEAVIRAAASGQPIDDGKLEALRRFTARIVEKRGWAEESDLQTFFAAGYTAEQALDVVLGVAVKTLSNYANHIMQTPVDGPFQANLPAPEAG